MTCSTLFGELPAPTDLAELMNVVSLSARGSSAFNTRMWRGQGDVDWPVHSGLYRRLGNPTEFEMREAEKYLLNAATHRGFRTQEGKELSDIELLAKLQHHGAATRLLDTSRSVLVALWFAAVSQPNKTGVLIGIHTDHLIGSEGKPLDMPYQDLVEQMTSKDYPYTWEPPPVSRRIAAQHSQFLLSSVSDDPRGSIHLPSDDGATLAVAITPSLKAALTKNLAETFDIRRLTLFPDLDGFCTAHDQRSGIFANERW